MILVTAFELLLFACIAIALIYWLPYLTMGACVLLAIWAAIMARKDGKGGW